MSFNILFKKKKDSIKQFFAPNGPRKGKGGSDL